jgi:hypothetical protein
MIDANVNVVPPLILVFIPTRLIIEKAPRCPIKKPIPSKTPIPMNAMQAIIKDENEEP